MVNIKLCLCLLAADRLWTESTFRPGGLSSGHQLPTGAVFQRTGLGCPS